MTLTEELAAFAAGMPGRRPPEVLATMRGATAALKASGIEERALGTGATAPLFTLPDATGNPVSLASLLADGPVVLLFYRGAWCPYCNLELRAYQKLLPKFHAAGAQVVAISPQKPDGSLTVQQKNELAFPVLSDVGSHTARAFGLAFDLPPALVEIYRASGYDLPVVNGNGDWVLPIPAVYVIATDRRIELAHIDADYTHRLDPEQALAALPRQAGQPAATTRSAT